MRLIITDILFVWRLDPIIQCMDPNYEKIIKIIVSLVIGIAVLVFVHYFLKKLVKKSDKIHRRFLGKLFNLIVIVVVLVYILELVDPSMDLRSTFLKGSALVVAIVGFAAQPAISDLICGFLISINKPFEIGDRIIAEGIEPGVVEDITLRHTIIRIYDGLRIIVPNSVLNTKTVINTSKRDERGIHLTFSVSYDTDLHTAIEAIRDCVAASPYTLPVETNGIMEDSGPVYFLKYAESALVLETTIWIKKESSSYVAVSDINMRVNDMFKQLGIEIPYNYLNVVEREFVAGEIETGKKKKKTAPSKRSVRSDTVKVSAGSKHIMDAVETAREFALKQRLDNKATRQLELMTEETIGIIGSIAESAMAKFWVDGSGLKYRIHLTFPASVGSEEYKKLLSLASSGKNEAVQTLSAKIWETMVTGLGSGSDNSSKSEQFEWSLRNDDPNVDEIAESILVALADDIKVSVTRDNVQLLVIKSVQ